MTPPSPPDDAPRDPLTAYVDGDPGAVRAARPPEPSEAEWDAVRRRVRARLRSPAPKAGRAARRRHGNAWLFVASAVAAAVVWVVFVPPPRPAARERAVTEQLPLAGQVAPLPHDPSPDPLAEFAVLPMAETDDVVLYRVPGDGWLPVGTHPLSGALALAAADDVELDEPDPAGPGAAPAPGCAPMIYAAKPR